MARNATYTSDKAVQEMVYVISEVIEMKILSEMKKSSHFSLMIDETTDCTVIEQLAVHGRYIDPSTGDLKMHYLKVVDTLEPEISSLDSSESSSIRLSAETISKRVLEYCDLVGFDKSKIRGIATDGAAVMVGKRNGVVARLRVHMPSIIGVHCAAHRLNLASCSCWSDNFIHSKIYYYPKATF